MVEALLWEPHHVLKMRSVGVTWRSVGDNPNRTQTHVLNSHLPQGKVPDMTRRSVIVFIAGSPWDGVPGTDVNLARALSQHIDVLWVEPPRPLTEFVRSRRPPPKRVRLLGDRLWQLNTVSPPGVSRPVIRSVAAAQASFQVRRTVARLDFDVVAAILASPEAVFPRGLAGERIYYVTDDWIAGSKLMGIGEARIAALQTKNLGAATSVFAVSPVLVETLSTKAPNTTVRLLPNGCNTGLYPGTTGSLPADAPGRPYAVFAGKINERIDIDVLSKIVAIGVPLVLVGPRRDRDSRIRDKINNLVSDPSVTWVGQKSAEDTALYISNAAVGLTPYRVDEFNVASFPLKTLDYLAAGIPAVSTALPAARLLATDLVTIAENSDDFVSRTVEFCQPGHNSSQLALERRRFAQTHDWDARAVRLLGVIRGIHSKP